MKTCIITGSGSGIGQATAIHLAMMKEYDHIAMIGRNMLALEETKKEMLKRDAHLEVSIWNMDLSTPKKATQIIDEIYASHGTINTLLNIAGYTDPQPLLSTTLENMEYTYAVNVFSPLEFIRASVRYMKKNGGKILLVASTAGMTPRPGWLSYATSKAAVIAMAKTLTEELAEYGILVYCISPGRCATKLRKRLAPNEEPSTIMQPNEVAQIICNLISENENCLDGQNIIIRKQCNVKKV
ncbi:MAG: SDR family oxidoreductase [Prevotella sp.]|nr:SDR family oxidoreductase [Prevotella sp.]